MRKHQLLLPYLLVFFILMLLQVQPVFSQQNQASPDITVKITEIDKLLDTIDRFSGIIPGTGQTPPSSIVKSMLNGTKWIDPDRAVVIGAVLKENIKEQPRTAVLIPFRTENDTFMRNYNALKGSDYYIAGLPPDQGGSVSEQMEKSLVNASLEPVDGLISLELASSRLIEKAGPRIQEMLQSIGQKIPAGDRKAEISAEQARQMLSGLVETGKQLEKVSLGFDMTGEEIAFFCNASPISPAGLEDVFYAGRQKEQLILADYKSSYDINFRSMPYDVSSVMDFFDRKFGMIYEQMGIDFGRLKKITSYFTGEMAGGVSFSRGGLELETIAVLDKSGQVPENYLESVYLPWIIDYGRAVAEFVSSQAPGVQAENFFEMLPPSTVAGRKAVGLKGKFPVFTGEGRETFSFKMRMTQLDGMLLSASDDEKLEKLISKAQSLEKALAAGPMMQMDMDLASYLNALNEFMPEQAGIKQQNIPELGSLKYTMDMTDGVLKTRYSVSRDAVAKMAGFFSSLKQAGKASGAGMSGQEGAGGGRKAAEEERPEAEKAKARPDKDSPQYWLDKGALFAAYGNERRAIENFKKALELDPENSLAYFHLGVSYGEAGKYERALDAVNRAISLEPENGDYYYARGWIYSLAGERGRARKNMKRAARLGSTDAEKYLESISSR